MKVKSKIIGSLISLFTATLAFANYAAENNTNHPITISYQIITSKDSGSKKTTKTTDVEHTDIVWSYWYDGSLEHEDVDPGYSEPTITEEYEEYFFAGGTTVEVKTETLQPHTSVEYDDAGPEEKNESDQYFDYSSDPIRYDSTFGGGYCHAEGSIDTVIEYNVEKKYIETVSYLPL